MKTCPACNRAFQDDGLSFCLDDGTALVSESTYDAGATIKIPAARLTSDAPTEVISEAQPPPTQAAPLAGRASFDQSSPLGGQNYTAAPEMTRGGRKSSAAPWILGAALVLGLSAIAVAVIITRGTESTQTASSNQTANIAVIENPGSTTGKMSEPGIASEQPRLIEVPVRTPTGSVRDESTRVNGPAQKPLSDTPPPPAPTPTPRPRPTAPISGGVLNGRAISKPAPAYPAIAKSARASGTVNVQVTIDESGNVISANAVSGHPLLQQAAVNAARQARFTPTLLSGQPVKVTGIVTYNFVLQ